MLAVKVAGLVALVAAPALAQPPSNPLNYQPGYPAGPAAAAPPGAAPLGQNPQPAQPPGVFPYPPGYRPRALPAQAGGQPPRSVPPAPAPDGSGGRVMYFQKPADALVASGAADAAAEGVAQLQQPAGGAAALPPPAWDASSVPLPSPLPPPPSRYLPEDRGAPALPSFGVPPAGSSAAAYAQQPKGEPEPKLGPDGLPIPNPKGSGDNPPPTPNKVPELANVAEVIKLPSRERIFMVYNDPQLERAIMDRILQDLLDINDKKPLGERKSREEVVRQQAPYLKYPPLPVLSPPGVPYQAKTAAYAPHQATLEPLYVVHRRLFFEEKNGERAGWDLGPLSTLVGTTHFYLDALLIPHNIAAGVVYGYWDTSAGKCLPGSPTPYYLYPRELTLTGSVFEAGVITGLAFVLFP